jgi:phosphoglycerol transferase MdoB-like AlkP superfamily enzyme
MSSVQVIAVEATLLLSSLAFSCWILGKMHRIAMQVYAGVADGVRLSRQTRFLMFTQVWGGFIFALMAANGLLALALLGIAKETTSPEATRIGYLFASLLALLVPYLLVLAVFMSINMTKIIRRGWRAERA